MSSEQPTTEVLTKSIWASRTLWFNVIMLIIGTIESALLVADVLEFTPQTVAIMGIATAFLWSLGNVIARGITEQPVSMTGGQTREVPAPRPDENQWRRPGVY